MVDRRDFGTIRRLPSGRYQASFIGPDLALHNAPVTFENKDLAVVWLYNEKKRIDQATIDDERWSSPGERAEVAVTALGQPERLEGALDDRAHGRLIRTEQAHRAHDAAQQPPQAFTVGVRAWWGHRVLLGRWHWVGGDLSAAGCPC